ncbi:hypothetical protein MYCTH_2119394 [Thermothelomyces thermophilus ATCC 42464]|uniref:Methyltransferase domain-containing protein n=1 Tax=Thermothelomyces thermophilus (strain ATCC 42464 / BCRC 31852 / DSM 1799) TaxID=573729 RepID=G2QF77_THET4|nr:uncharacterized protein MYCTH_2119394 [Thermothelomyces thermophilus ATCC 42464]AEO59106.1 hypothetical protein MYCTH_2119394 [Thermothelomyces thermophilus ATCC 42464]
MNRDNTSGELSQGTVSPSRPSTSSTEIAVAVNPTPEEDLYAAALAMREAISQDDDPGEDGHEGDDEDDDEDDDDDEEEDEEEEEEEEGPGGGGGGGGVDDSNNAFAFDDDMDRYPASMTSSVRDHLYEGGLRYHAYRAGKYAFPNDETEQNRDDMKHTMTLMLCHGAYFYAPVEEVLKRGGEVLDLGTGTGIWAMELGDKYPNSTITGIDLSPIQPTFVPENVHFFVDDFEEDWVDPPNKYDFIHIRHTLHSVKDVDALLSRVMRHLKPGGYFEIQELGATPQSDDGTLTPETPYALRDYINFIIAGLRVLGSDGHAVLRMPERMRAAGFEDVRRTTHKCPLGAWPRDRRLRFCGLFLRTALMDGLRGLSHRPLTALGWTQLQIEMFLVDVRKALMESSVHAYFTLYMIHGRKPLS